MLLMIKGRQLATFNFYEFVWSRLAWFWKPM